MFSSLNPKNWNNKLKQGLKKTRQQFQRLTPSLFSGNTLDDHTLESIETTLLLADLGINTTDTVLEKLKAAWKKDKPDSSDALLNILKEILISILTPVEQPLTINTQQSPFVILMIGVNGAGKTTSIAKIAHHFQQQKNTVMLAAGDTFRAAAIEQLQSWGNKNDIPVITQSSGADSASVIFDALQSAKAKSYDLLIADTAGRLHTQHHLMAELQKIKRVMKKIDDQAPHETLLVIDATMGQNALIQAQQFQEAMDVSGIVLTKLDGTAKGGIIFSIAETLKIPIRFIGVGEGADDLKPFNAKDFVQALLPEGDIEND